MMSKELGQQMIHSLAMDIESGKLNILGKEYTVTKIGKYTISLIGAKGAKYTITSCPNAKVIQDKTMPVYSLVKGSKVIDFGWISGNAIELSTNHH